MTFMDIIEMRSLRARSLSSDGKWLVYSVAIPNWKKGEQYTDLFLASTDGRASRQMTFTADKNEDSPAWAPDDTLFAFLSDREGKKQIYFMRPDGGEAQKMTDHKDGVGAMHWSKDGKRLAYTAGKAEERQLWILEKANGKPWQLTRHETPVRAFLWSPDNHKIYFTAADSVDQFEKKRKEKNFDVKVIDPPQPPVHLWMVDLESKATQRLTSGTEFTIETGQGIEVPTVQNVVISKDGRKIALRGRATDRYATWKDNEIYLLDLPSGKLARVTNNKVAEGTMSFSPDSKWFAFSAPNDFTFMRSSRVYLMPSDGGAWRKLGDDFADDVSLGFWSPDSQTIYFNQHVGTSGNLYAVSTRDGNVRQVTKENGVVAVNKDEDTDLLLVSYTDPEHSSDLYISTLDKVQDLKQWTQLTHLNPQVENLALGSYETIRWKSTDGTLVEGILVKPVGYEPDKRYPLIVQIHGGPAGSVSNTFAGSYGTYVHIYASNGYAVLQPNYRGSTAYGEKFKMAIAGDYFRQGYDDIITGVDYLIEKGIADPNALGMMGWSAGGHWSNWTLVSTDRFKAISTGAGAVDWISMYAETDIQDVREFYFKGMPYDNWDHYVAVSPLKYIKRAKTPTLIHVGEKDPRVPKPQSDELHMALKKLNVPTEYIVYPGMPHGITKPRYQMVKMVAEFNWFERWIKGKPGWIDWKMLLDTLPRDEEEKEGKKKKEPEPTEN
jgi:dipeptidyl aminopeptidase/acylaminoacyl peptidase